MKGVRLSKIAPNKFTSRGTLAVEIVCRPGPSTSKARPSRKNTALWDSRTITWEPKRRSAIPASGKR